MLPIDEKASTRRAWRAAPAVLLLTAACATRTVPARFPETSAASPSAPAALHEQATRALTTDVPLPGEATDGWPGLEEAAPTAPATAAPLPDEAHTRLQAPLTAESAVQVALLNNRELRALKHELEVAHGRVQSAGTLPNPELEFELRVPRAEATEDVPTKQEVRLEYDLTSALLAPVRAGVARAEFDAAQVRTAGRAVELAFRVRAAVYALQAAEQRLALATQGLDAAAAARDAAEALFEAGNTPELDEAQQTAAYEEVRVGVSALELEVLERREALRRLLGLHGEEARALRVAPGLPGVPDATPATEQLETRVLDANLELAELKARLEAAARRTGLARAQGWVPDVSVAALAEREEQGWEWGGAVTLALPFFDRRQGEARSAEAGFDALMERYHGTAVDVRSAAREARARLESAHARVQHFQKAVLPARARALQQAMLQYNAMQRGVFTLIALRRAQLDAGLAHVESLRDYWTARAALDALLAGQRVDIPASTAPAVAGNTDASGGH